MNKQLQKRNIIIYTILFLILISFLIYYFTRKQETDTQNPQTQIKKVSNNSPTKEEPTIIDKSKTISDNKLVETPKPIIETPMQKWERQVREENNRPKIKNKQPTIEYLRHLTPPIVRVTHYKQSDGIMKEEIIDYLLNDNIDEESYKNPSPTSLSSNFKINIQDFDPYPNHNNSYDNYLYAKYKRIINKDFTSWADCGLIYYKYDKHEPDTPSKQPYKITGKNDEIIWERKPNSTVTSENDVVIETDRNGKQIFKFDPSDQGDYTINGESKSLPIKNWYRFRIE